MGFEVTDFWGLAGLAGRHIHRGFRESVRGPNCEFSKIETAKPVDKALEGRRMHPFTAAEDGFDPSKVEPGQVVIYCFAAVSSKAKFGAAENAWPSRAINCSHRAGRCRNATGLVSTAPHPTIIGAQTPRTKPMS